MTAHQPGTRGATASEYLTPAEIARLLQLSTMTVYRLIEQGELPAVRIGRQFRVRRTALDQYLADAEAVA